MLSLFLDQKNTRYISLFADLMIASHGICIAWDQVLREHNLLVQGSADLHRLLLLLTGISLIGATTDPITLFPEDPTPTERRRNGGKATSRTTWYWHYANHAHYPGKQILMRQNEHYAYTDAQGVLRDHYTGAVILTDYEMVVTELAGKEGWLIADRKLDSLF